MFKHIPRYIERNIQIISRNIVLSSCFYKSYKKYLDYSKVPTIQHADLEIQYVRGSGPGGQATNKTNNAVVMKHTPSGLVVKCHETRSQFKNEEIAKQLLIKKLDVHLNGEDSIQHQEMRIAKKFLLEKQRRQKKLAALKKSFKEKNELV